MSFSKYWPLIIVSLAAYLMIMFGLLRFNNPKSSTNKSLKRETITLPPLEWPEKIIVLIGKLSLIMSRQLPQQVGTLPVSNLEEKAINTAYLFLSPVPPNSDNLELTAATRDSSP